MNDVFTVTTELKLNKEYNQLVGKYISDYIELFNKIQRLTFHRIKNYYIKNGKITQKDRNIINKQLQEEFGLTSRAIDAILSNMLGRYNSIKELKEFERKSLERKISTLDKELTKLKDERTLQRINLKNDYQNFNFIKYKNLKIKIYWKQNRLNTKKQKLKNLENEIKSGKYKVCFGTKALLQKDYSKFVKKRDSEIYYLGRAGDATCNNNFQVEYSSKINQFYFRIRKEIDLDNDKFVYGQFYFNNKIYTNLLKNLLRTKESALTYRIKIKDDKVLLQIIYNFAHNKDLCVTRNSYGVIGLDFNKGFVSVSETDKYGNLINTFNIDYQYGKGNQTTNDFQYIATGLKDYCLNTGKDLVIEKLNFTKKKDNLISKRGKKYNEMLSSLAYSKFDLIITSKCAKNRIFLHKVNPAWTSWIAKQKYCPKMKLNIHSGASYVIARRGMLLKDKIK
jgi:transposase, IS605 orfB family